jgi:hypothetical protein
VLSQSSQSSQSGVLFLVPRSVINTMKRCLSTGTINIDDPFIMKTHKKAKKPQQKNQAKTTQPLIAVDNVSMPISQVEMDDVINAVINSVENTEKSKVGQGTSAQIELNDILESVATGHAELNVQGETIKFLKQQVDGLLATVLELRTQVERLLSALDWTVQRAPNTKPKPGSGPVVQSTRNDSEVQQAAAASPSTTSSSYSEVVLRRPNTQRISRDAVVAAVYVDQQRQNSRVANLVVSGLQPLPSVADATAVIDLCRSELGIVPDIVYCRRLGKMNPGRVQPLLVVLRSADQADEIMANAKNLRKSTHSVIREGVFVNRHLTDAQSRAAFELRCIRRDAASRRDRRGAPPSTNADTLSRLVGAAAPVAPGFNVAAAAFISNLSAAN